MGKLILIVVVFFGTLLTLNTAYNQITPTQNNVAFAELSTPSPSASQPVAEPTLPATPLLEPTFVASDSPPVFSFSESSIIYGTTAKNWRVENFVGSSSYLWQYTNVIEGRSANGVETIQLVADRTRVNPKLLVAIVEMRTGWVTDGTALKTDNPLSLVTNTHHKLYRQLDTVANRINSGFYHDKSSGQVAVNNMMSMFAGSQTIADMHTAYYGLFGVPENIPLSSPTAIAIDLPFQDATWYLTGGAHGGWNTGSAWAAIDLIDPTSSGCGASSGWVTAVADGYVTRSDYGAVVQDLDGDQSAETGWAILYQHIATNDRVPKGTYLNKGDRVGHPSCEGGFSTGAHLHFARTFDGRWIGVDDVSAPLVLGGWQFYSSNSEYQGSASRSGINITAVVGRGQGNAVQK